MEKTDEELYKDFLNGNKKAFEDIVIKYHYNLVYFISRYTKDINIAEDIAQDVFVYILVNKNYYNSKYSLKSYLFTIAKSRTINYLKRESRKIDLENIDEIFDDNIDIIENINNKEKLKKIECVLKRLKPDYQTIIYLADFEGMSNKEISKILNKTNLQIKTLLYNARKKFKDLLKKEGISYDE